ncbi:hypothetical protein WD019_12010 [Fictibacillus sp. Mic-4]|uniref:hypothetical protein n=1 Tax=Fictibacillus sp. Mic-4 TaxID=3132826 RepID=UPI003CF86B97
MEISVVIFSIAMMAIMIAIGCLLARKVPFTAERRELLIAIIVNVAMPCIILNSIFHTKMDQQIMMV